MDLNILKLLIFVSLYIIFFLGYFFINNRNKIISNNLILRAVTIKILLKALLPMLVILAIYLFLLNYAASFGFSAKQLANANPEHHFIESRIRWLTIFVSIALSFFTLEMMGIKYDLFKNIKNFKGFLMTIVLAPLLFIFMMFFSGYW